MTEQHIEYVESFTYLESTISKTGGTEEDTKSRIGKARPVCVTLKPVWNNSTILLKTNLTIFNSNVKSVLLYGSETWKHNKALYSKLQVFVNTCLRQILRIRWPGTISNEELWRIKQQRPITDVIKERKWGWVGHTLRRNSTSITILDWNHQAQARPSNHALEKNSRHWPSHIWNVLGRVAKQKAQDRRGW